MKRNTSEQPTNMKFELMVATHLEEINPHVHLHAHLGIVSFKQKEPMVADHLSHYFSADCLRFL